MTTKTPNSTVYIQAFTISATTQNFETRYTSMIRHVKDAIAVYQKVPKKTILKKSQNLWENDCDALHSS